MCVYTHTRPSLTLPHTHPQKAQKTFLPSHPQEVLRLRKVEIGCSFVFSMKARVEGSLIGCASRLLVTQCFLCILCLQTFSLIPFIVLACTGWIYRWECAAAAAAAAVMHCGWSQWTGKTLKTKSIEKEIQLWGLTTTRYRESVKLILGEKRAATSCK